MFKYTFLCRIYLLEFIFVYASVLLQLKNENKEIRKDVWTYHVQ